MASDSIRIAVIGGGAAGFFAAISAAEVNPDARITVFEKSGRFLSKVKISGGGRCNVTHACFDPRELVTRYPRGSKELLGPFYQWQPSDMVAWLEHRGVTLKTESDGRMFPITDSSQTIIDCLEVAALEHRVSLRSRVGVERIQCSDTDTFTLETVDGETLHADRVVIATGGGKQGSGHSLAQSLGHTITPTAPSLFTFHIDDERINGLQGLSVPNAHVSSPEANLSQTGPVLITHWGLSGPAILKLSAWGARAFAQLDYTFELVVNWTGALRREQAIEQLARSKRQHGAKQVGSHSPLGLPKRLWERFLQLSEIPARTQYSQVSNAQLDRLANQATESRFQVAGKSMNKEEFVTCGGVALDEVDFKRMESKRVPNLFFAGETLDIDGVTGGFNFQAAWTTGHIAGTSAAI